MARQLLITGAAGRIGQLLRPRLARPGWTLRLLDAAAQTPPSTGEKVEIVQADILDAAAMRLACTGVDAVLHLAALAVEDTWENLLRVNVDGTRTVLEAARTAGVRRVVLASSIHAAGFYRQPGTAPRPDGVPAPVGLAGVPAPVGPDGVPADVFPRPDTYYGWSKAAGESLGSLYADRFGMVVIALRIGACKPEPPGERGLDSWLSPDDCARLVSACLDADVSGFRVLWGVSRNTRRWWSLAEGQEIGYDPRDDAELYAVSARPFDGERTTAGLLGGHFCALPLGVPRSR